MSYKRRKFIKKSTQLGTGLILAPWLLESCKSEKTTENNSDQPSDGKEMFFKISLAEWSLHRTIFEEKKLTNLDFPRVTREEFGLDAVEFVNQMFFDKAEDQSYLTELKMRCDDHGIKSQLIMCDREGNLGASNKKERIKAVENHYKWADAAKFLGCHTIRVNAAGEGSYEEVRDAAVDGLGRLSEYAKTLDLNVTVENHGGYSSDGTWLATVMQEVGMDNCGTLPDFGNFCLRRAEGSYDCVEEYDRYKGVKELMPYAKAVSAKTHEFNRKGDEIHTDYKKMLKIVKDAGYSGYIGVEYEGNQLDEYTGIKKTIELMKRVGMELS